MAEFPQSSKGGRIMQIVSSFFFGSAAALVVDQLPVSKLRRIKGRTFKIGEHRKESLRNALGEVRGDEETLQMVLRMQFVAGLSALAISILLVAINPVPLSIVASFLIVAGAWQIPLIASRLKEKQRRIDLEIELSDALGEMVMGVEAGLTLEAVMNLYSHRHHTSLASEFGYVLGRINIGASRLDALEELYLRTPTPSVQMFVSAVQQNQKLGTPLAAVLRQQGQTARRRRRQAVEEQAAKLSLKMVFPTIFCILPVLLIVIVGPAIVRLLHALPK